MYSYKCNLFWNWLLHFDWTGCEYDHYYFLILHLEQRWSIIENHFLQNYYRRHWPLSSSSSSLSSSVLSYFKFSIYFSCCSNVVYFHVRCFNSLSPNGDQQQFSPNNIHTLSRDKVMRINKVITIEKIPSSFIKFSQLILKGDVWRSVWRNCMWILGLKGLTDVYKGM